jgi:hypothetical protein
MRQTHSVLLIPVSCLESWKTLAKNVIERQLNFQIKPAISFEQFWQLRIEMSGTLRKEIAGLAPAQLPTIKQAVADVARRYFMSGTMSFPAEALIVSGRKSAPERIECLSATSVNRSPLRAWKSDVVYKNLCKNDGASAHPLVS